MLVPWLAFTRVPAKMRSGPIGTGLTLLPVSIVEFACKSAQWKGRSFPKNAPTYKTPRRRKFLPIFCAGSFPFSYPCSASESRPRLCLIPRDRTSKLLLYCVHTSQLGYQNSARSPSQSPLKRGTSDPVPSFLRRVREDQAQHWLDQIACVYTVALFKGS
jgi:hypothetical protein